MGVTPTRTLASKDEVPTPRSSTREEDFLRNAVEVFRETPSILRKARASTSFFFFLFTRKRARQTARAAGKKETIIYFLRMNILPTQVKRTTLQASSKISLSATKIVPSKIPFTESING